MNKQRFMTTVDKPHVVKNSTKILLSKIAVMYTYENPKFLFPFSISFSFIFRLPFINGRPQDSISVFGEKKVITPFLFFICFIFKKG